MESDLTTFLPSTDPTVQLWNKIDDEFQIGQSIISKAWELHHLRLEEDEENARIKKEEEAEQRRLDKIKREEEKVIREKKKLAELKQKYEE